MNRMDLINMKCTNLQHIIKIDRNLDKNQYWINEKNRIIFFDEEEFKNIVIKIE